VTDNVLHIHSGAPFMYRFEKTGEFSARSESGFRYQIVEYTKVVNLADAQTPSRWEAVGPKQYQLHSGEPVKMLSDRDFVITQRRPVRITRQ
jgi:hypothetical protein